MLRAQFSRLSGLYPKLAVLAGASIIAGCRDALAPATPRARFVARPSRDGIGVKSLPIVEGRVILRVRPGANSVEVAEDHGAIHDGDLTLERASILEVQAGTEEAAVAALAADPRVEFAELDVLTAVAPCDVGSCQTTDDAFFNVRWDLNNTGEIRNPAGALIARTGKADADVDWLEMFDALGPAPQGSAVVGIIDTGIHGSQQDLGGRVVAAKNFAAGYPETFTDDRVGHGTHVAGIVAANTTNGTGAAGIAYGPNIRLINAKACDYYLIKQPPPDTASKLKPYCPASSVVKAIEWAVKQGADVLNLSLGTEGFAPDDSGSKAQQAALQEARSKNVLAFCSAGNENFGNVGFPARFEECVAVGATNWSDRRASYSNYGSKVALSAPGGDFEVPPYSYIFSTYADASGRDNLYAFNAGTSMAVPQVAGLAAMLYASGIKRAEDVLDRLQQTADDLGAPGRDPEFGYGRINAYRALTLKDPGAPPMAHIDPVAPGVEGAPVSFSSAGSSDPNNHPVTFVWTFGDGATSTEPNPTHTYVDNGTYRVTLAVTDESKRTTTATTDVDIANLPPVVAADISMSKISSGAALDLHGTFTDAGVNDAPWHWEIDWGGITQESGIAETQSSAIDASHAFCRAGHYSIRLAVKDKDGGSGVAQQTLIVTRNGVRIGLPVDLDDDRHDRRGYRDDRDGREHSRGMIAAVVFSTASFDATTLDPSTVTLGDGEGAETPVARRRDGSFDVVPSDENHDKRRDLVLYFDRRVILDFVENFRARPGRLSRDHPLFTVVLRGALADQCTEVEGSWSFKLKGPWFD